MAKVAKKVTKKVSKKLPTPKGRWDGIDALLDLAGEKAGCEYLDGEAELITASKIQLPTSFLSVSQIEMYMRCPYQYKRRYVDGVKSPPGVALVEGDAHHKALEQNNRHKIRTGNDLKPQKMVEIFADTFTERKKEVEDWDRDNPDSVISRGKTMIGAYSRQFAPLLRPLLAEMATAVPLGPELRIYAVLDVLGHMAPAMKGPISGVVPTALVDYKTVSQARSQKEVDSSLQLSAYSYIAAIDTEADLKKLDVGLCCLVKTTGAVKWVKAKATAGRALWFRRVALSVANQISLGNFPLTADPTHWSCSPKFCGYWGSCRGKVESIKSMAM